MSMFCRSKSDKLSDFQTAGMIHKYPGLEIMKKIVMLNIAEREIFLAHKF